MYMRLKHLLLSTLLLSTPIFAQRYVGGDISLLPSYEAAKTWYVDENQNHITDMLQYFRSQGLNSMRVRLFVDPSKASSADKQQGVCQDLAYVKALGKRIKDAGFSLLLDFHYSDSWADPGKQWTPAAWQSLNDTQLANQLYSYTKDCLEQMVAAGATPDFIQTGNEISYGMLWGPTNTQANRCYTNSDAANWTRFFTLLGKAGAACREVCPNAKIILHSERVPKPNVLKDWLDRLKNNNVNYDIIGLSYYPFHHGSLSQLEQALKQCANYNKDIMIVETGYYYAWQPSNVEYDLKSTWPITPAGQQKFTKDLITTLKKYDRVTGLYWWWMEASENGVSWQNPVTKDWYNASLFNDNNMDDTGWYYGKVMPAMQELKSFVGESSSVSVVKPASVDDHWYTLGGQQLPARPQRSGVYLHHDRKQFVK